MINPDLQSHFQQSTPLAIAAICGVRRQTIKTVSNINLNTNKTTNLKLLALEVSASAGKLRRVTEILADGFNVYCVRYVCWSVTLVRWLLASWAWQMHLVFGFSSPDIARYVTLRKTCGASFALTFVRHFLCLQLNGNKHIGGVYVYVYVCMSCSKILGTFI